MIKDAVLTKEFMDKVTCKTCHVQNAPQHARDCATKVFGEEFGGDVVEERWNTALGRPRKPTITRHPKGTAVVIYGVTKVEEAWQDEMVYFRNVDDKIIASVPMSGGGYELNDEIKPFTPAQRRDVINKRAIAAALNNNATYQDVEDENIREVVHQVRAFRDIELEKNALEKAGNLAKPSKYMLGTESRGCALHLPYPNLGCDRCSTIREGRVPATTTLALINAKERAIDNEKAKVLEKMINGDINALPPGRPSYLTDPAKWQLFTEEQMRKVRAHFAKQQAKPAEEAKPPEDNVGFDIIDDELICNCDITPHGKVDNPKCPECFPPSAAKVDSLAELVAKHYDK